MSDHHDQGDKKKPTPQPNEATELLPATSKFINLLFKHYWKEILSCVVTLIGASLLFLWHNYNHRFDPLNTNLIQINKRLDQFDLWLNGRYPSNGLIAEFSGSTQRDIRTDYGEELSLLSDSAHGGSSLVWYERILHDPTKGLNSDGFLRIHYHLNPKNDATVVPYVGIFAYFANPPKMFDVSSFKDIQVIARIDHTNVSACEYSFHLLDLIAASYHDYRWAECQLYLPIGSGYSTNRIRLEDLKTPRPFPPTPVDLTHVFGFAIQILAADNKESEGYLDIDDIRFLP
jgi:hypothetical protein